MTRPADIARDSGRPFLESHPWIRFEVDLQRVPWRFWEQLGEVRSKCRHIATTPLPPAVSQQLAALYLAKGALATTAIEGNTLTEEQALEAVQGQLQLPLSQEYQRREIENIVGACRAIEREVFAGEGFEITPARLASLNRQVLDGLELEEGVVPGEHRTGDVVVGNVYRGAPAGDCEFLVAQMCDWLNGSDFAPAEDRRESFLRVFLRAAVAHVYIAWIHPFGDGNGRTARLVEFGILIAAGIPSVSAHLLSNHYNLTRTAYYRQLDRASRSGGDLSSFFSYAIEGFVDGLEQQLETVRGVNFESAWHEYVDELFAGGSTPAKRRQRNLVLALPTDKPVPRSRITTLTPELATLYAGKQSKTVTRDINALAKLGLIERGPAGIRARAEMMLGFVPHVADGGVI
jgi:cell filamentation protein, protein adenylyltransferase